MIWFTNVITFVIINIVSIITCFEAFNHSVAANRECAVGAIAGAGQSIVGAKRVAIFIGCDDRIAAVT